MNEAILTAVVGLTTALVSWVTVRVTRRKVSAEGTQIITQTALSLIEPLQKQLVELRQRVSALETELQHERITNRLLVKQIEELGHTPITRGPA